MPALVSSDLPTEWKTFRRYITNQPKEDLNQQLKELSTNSMLETVSKLEHSGKGVLDHSSRNCFCGALILTDEINKNPTKESLRRY